MPVLEGHGNKSVAGLPQKALLEKPSEKFLIWFTAFLEADGHVRHGDTHLLKVTQSGEKGKKQCIMIRGMFNEVGSIHVERPENMSDKGGGRNSDNWKPIYRWSVTDPEVIAQILEWIEPLADPYTKLEGEFKYYKEEF